MKIKRDRPWSEYPIGTKAHAFNGGYWEKVKLGWKWCTGATFPTPGGDAIGQCVELPDNNSVEVDLCPCGAPALDQGWCPECAPYAHEG